MAALDRSQSTCALGHARRIFTPPRSHRAGVLKRGIIMMSAALILCAALPSPLPPLIELSVATRTIARVAPYFIGVTLDYANICKRQSGGVAECKGAMTLPLTTKLARLASMTPDGAAAIPSWGLLRIGGSRQDSVLFLGPNETCPINAPKSRFAARSPAPQYQCSQDKPNGQYVECFSTRRMEELCAFAAASRLKLIIGLNACVGRASVDSPMDVRSFAPFLASVAGCAACKGALFGFELGNELDLHVYNHCDGVEPEALAADMQALASLSASIFDGWAPAERPRFAGPDIAAFTGTTAMPDEDALRGTNYFTRYLNAAPRGQLAALTFHQYVYCDRSGDTPGMETVIDLDCLARLRAAGHAIKALTTKHAAAQTEAWVGESSNVFMGGRPNISDVTFDAFYYAEQLQAMASTNVSAVVRQDLLGSYYGLLAYPDLTPKPSYWVAYLWKLLVGRDVFLISEKSPGEAPIPLWLHASVHCGKRPGVEQTAVLINHHTVKAVRVTVTALAATATASPRSTSAFVLSGDVYSDHMTLNGAPLALQSDGSLPLPAGQPAPAGDAVLVPAKSIAFIEISGSSSSSSSRWCV